MNVMPTVEIRESLVAFLAQNFGLDPGEIGDQEPLFSSGVLDSFSMVQLVLFVEETAGLRLNPDDVTLDNFDTIECIMRFLEAASEA